MQHQSPCPFPKPILVLLGILKIAFSNHNCFYFLLAVMSLYFPPLPKIMYLVLFVMSKNSRKGHLLNLYRKWKSKVWLILNYVILNSCHLHQALCLLHNIPGLSGIICILLLTTIKLSTYVRQLFSEMRS